MFRAGLLLLVTLGSVAHAQEFKPSQLGKLKPPFPQIGSLIPSKWPIFVLNGDRQDYLHCPICRHNLKPVVIIVTKDPAKDDVWNLLKDLETLVVQEDKESQLQAFLVLLHPQAGLSIVKPEIPAKGLDFKKVAEELVDETNKRTELLERMRKDASKFQKVIVGCYPALPADLKLDGEAETQVVFYRRYEVVETWKFAAGAFGAAEAGEILKKVKETIQPKVK